MRSLHRGIALGVGLAIGRMLSAALNLVLGLVTVCTIGMFLTRHWVLGSLLFLGANLGHSWFVGLWLRED